MRLSALTLVSAAAALVCSAPAMAQATLEELTVTGHIPGAQLQILSEIVNYADLDLNYARDRYRLLVRVNGAARRVCTRLNEESPNAANLGRSCQERAVRGAMDQVRFAVADARASASASYVDTYGAPVSARVRDTGLAAPAYVGPDVVSNRPIPDTPRNRARYGGPMSRAGQRSGPDGR